MSAAQLPPGTVVDGRFALGAVVRRRRGATVYAVTDSQGNAAHATIYDATCFPSALVRERSLRELRQLQGLDSPRIVTVLDCGKLDDGGAFEITAIDNDPTLAEGLVRGAWAPADAAGLLMQVGEALLAAQKVGVIHRNLGPAVIHAGQRGVRLGGFAVGEPHGDGAFGPTATIAPEQVEGKIVDQRTLIFNLAALMQLMLSGAPLYEGDDLAALQAYAQADPSDDTHASLKRALSRDARMRPMMLRQFLGELAAIGGVAVPTSAAVSGAAPASPTPAGATPTSRGWTMFMKDDATDDDAGDGDAGDGRGGPAVAPAVAPVAAKPSTRGWTMFMEAAGDTPPAQEAAPAAPAPAEVKPSTRGWTMFMEATDEDNAGDTASETPAPAAEAKPSTRGWTMFMEDDEPEAAAAPGPAAEPSAPAEVSALPEPAPEPDAPKAKPTTRGWTMFMEDEDGAEPDVAAPGVAAPGVAAPEVAAPAVAAPQTAAPHVAAPPVTAPEVAAPAAQAEAPAASGWTMFQEPSEPMPPLEADAPVAATPEQDSDLARGGKKRGWTMFMDAPLPNDADGAALGGPKHVDAPSPATEANQRGWTVFGADAQLRGEAAAVSPPAEPAEPAESPTKRARVQTMLSTPEQAAPAASSPADLTMPAPGRGTADLTMPAPGAGPAYGQFDAATGAAKTVIATGLEARAGAAGGVTGRAELPAGAAPGSIAPHGDPRTAPFGGPGVPQAIAPRPSAELVKPSSGKAAIVAVGAVVVIGGLVAAWFVWGG